jgi:hypothetical protein
MCTRLGAVTAYYSRQMKTLKKPFTRLLFRAVEHIGELELLAWLNVTGPPSRHHYCAVLS